MGTVFRQLSLLNNAVPMSLKISIKKAEFLHYIMARGQGIISVVKVLKVYAMYLQVLQDPHGV